MLDHHLGMVPLGSCVPRRAWRLAIVVALVFATLATAPSAAAQPGLEQDDATSDETRRRAEALRKQGDDALQARRYRDALNAYDGAYELLPAPLLLFARGRAQRALGRFPKALALFEQFRAEASASQRERVEALDALIEEMRGASSTLSIVCAVPGARVLVRERELGVTPLSGPLHLNAGEATVRIEAKGYVPYRETVLLPGAGELSLVAELLVDPRKARLLVRSNATGATAFVDGYDVGMVPAEARLMPGDHEITVRREDLGEASTSVLLEGRQRKEIDVELYAPAAFYETWWFWTGVGVAVTAAVVITAAVVVANSDDETSNGTSSSSLVTFEASF